MTEAIKRTDIGEFVSIRSESRVAHVLVDRGDGLNLLSHQCMLELKQAAEHLRSDVETSVAVLSGAGGFCAGADLHDPELREQPSKTLLEHRQIMAAGPEMCQAWASLEQVTIAAVDRHCIGGGLALAVSLDHRIVAQDATIRAPEVPLGMNMSWGSVPRIVSLVGLSRTKSMIILGRTIDALSAEAWGLVDEVVHDGGVLERALSLAADYAALPPVALRMAKQSIEASAQPLAYATSYMDRDQFLLTQMMDDQKEGVQAFLEKRPGKFRGD
ncbi:MAG: enoyl-CoA hydratase/isomerase family protein [Pseudomonadota bacterium]